MKEVFYKNSVVINNYSVESFEEGILIIADSKQGCSITNSAKEVVEDVVKKYKLLKQEDGESSVIYKDSTGRYDVLRVKDGEFVGFGYLGVGDRDSALKIYKKNQGLK